jgi:hypothetical protein
MSILKAITEAVSPVKRFFYPPEDPTHFFNVAPGAEGIEILNGPDGNAGLLIDKDKLETEERLFDPAEQILSGPDNSLFTMTTGDSKQKLQDQTKLANEFISDLMEGDEGAIAKLASLEPIVALTAIKGALRTTKESLSKIGGTEEAKRPLTDYHINALLNIYIPSGMRLSLTSAEVKAILSKVDASDYEKLPPAFIRDHVLGNGIKIKLSDEYINEKLLPIIGQAGTSTVLPAFVNSGNPTDKEMSLFSRGFYIDPYDVAKFFSTPSAMDKELDWRDAMSARYGYLKKYDEPLEPDELTNEDIVMEVFLSPPEKRGDDKPTNYAIKLRKTIQLLEIARRQFKGINGVLKLYRGIYKNLGNIGKSNKFETISTEYDKRKARMAELSRSEQERGIEELNQYVVNQIGLLIADDLADFTKGKKAVVPQVVSKLPKFYRGLLDMFIDLLPPTVVTISEPEAVQGKTVISRMPTAEPTKPTQAGPKNKYYIFLYPKQSGYPIPVKGETKKTVKQRLRKYTHLNVSWDVPQDVRDVKPRRGGDHLKQYVPPPEEESPPLEPGGDPGEKVATAPGMTSEGIDLPREIPLNPARDNLSDVREMGLGSLTHSQYIGWGILKNGLPGPIQYKMGEKRPPQMMPYNLAPGLKGAEAIIKRISSTDPKKGGRGALPKNVSIQFNVLAKNDEPDEIVDIDDIGKRLSKGEIDFLNKKREDKIADIDDLKKPRDI